jgi:hypothetical protein
MNIPWLIIKTVLKSFIFAIFPISQNVSHCAKEIKVSKGRPLV